MVKLKLKERRAQLYDQLRQMDSDYKTKEFTPAVAREFSALCDMLDIINAQIQSQEIQDKLLDQVEENGLISPFSVNPVNNPWRRDAAKKTLYEGFQMLSRGERKKIDSEFLLELGEKNGFREMRTEFPSDNIVSTEHSNVFLELVKDDALLKLFPTETIRETYYKIPLVTREDYPEAEGKANDAAASGTDTNFTSFTMTPKNSYVINRYHKDLLRDAGNRAKDAIWESSKAAINKRLVNMIMYGDSANNGEFNGFDNISGKTVYDTSGGSIVDYSLITRGAKELNNRFVPHEEIVTLMSPNTYNKYSDLRELTSSGMYLTPPDQIGKIPMLSNAQVKTNYSTNKTRLYMFRPQSALLGLFGNFEMELNERYAEYDHAAYMIVFRSDFVMRDPEHLFIATNLPTT